LVILGRLDSYMVGCSTLFLTCSARGGLSRYQPTRVKVHVNTENFSQFIDFYAYLQDTFSHVVHVVQVLGPYW